MNLAEEQGVASLPHPGHLRAVRESSCMDGCPALKAEVSSETLLEAQRRWAAKGVVERLRIIRRARRAMAAQAQQFAEAISPTLQRSQADTLVTELLPLLDAMRFLERLAPGLLASHQLSATRRPLWLTGVVAEIQHVPLGHVLVIAPANFPLFLAGVQVMQALVAGNTVTWKPGIGGQRVALLVAKVMHGAGLPPGVLAITDESVAAAQEALAARPDKVVFTGSAEVGKKVLRTLAETATPALMELSGVDAVAVLPSADLEAAAKAVAFGLRLNGSEVCMSPRRLVLTRETWTSLRPLLKRELAAVPPVPLKATTATLLRDLATDAVAHGAQVEGEVCPEAQYPLVIEHCRPEMAITKTDLFAPVLAVIEARNPVAFPDLINACPYALTVAVFGKAREAKALGDQLQVGTVVVNDLIAPTADPRISFSGRRASGFGATRGAEGLLEMTATKAVLVRRRPLTQHYRAVSAREVPLFASLIEVLHGSSWMRRLAAVRRLALAAQAAKTAAA